MDELATLRDRIGLLLAQPDAQTPHGRALLGSPGPAVIAEIAQTQLPRRLAFTNDRGEVVTLCVRAGRILMLQDGSSASLLGDAAGLVGQKLQDGEATALQGVLARFVNGVRGLWVQSDYLATAVDEAETGIAVPDLGANAGAPSKGGLSDFVQHCKPMARAVLWADQETQILSTGPETDLAVLSDLAAVELSEGAIDPSPSCVILAGPVAGGQGVLCGRFEGALVFVVFPADLTGQIMRLWRAALGQAT